MLSMANLNDLEIAYIAGLFDGEGCITIHKGSRIYPNQFGYGKNVRYTLNCIISNTDKTVLEKFKEKTGLGIVYTRKDTAKGRRQSYQWILASNQAEQFLIALLPYLQIKKAQAIVALQFQEFIHSQRGHHQLSIDDLNTRQLYKDTMSWLNTGRYHGEISPLSNEIKPLQQ